MQDFVNNLERINAIADKSKGFVWHLIDDEDGAPAVNIFKYDYLLICLFGKT